MVFVHQQVITEELLAENVYLSTVCSASLKNLRKLNFAETSLEMV